MTSPSPEGHKDGAAKDAGVATIFSYVSEEENSFNKANGIEGNITLYGVRVAGILCYMALDEYDALSVCAGINNSLAPLLAKAKAAEKLAEAVRGLQCIVENFVNPKDFKNGVTDESGQDGAKQALSD